MEIHDIARNFRTQDEERRRQSAINDAISTRRSKEILQALISSQTPQVSFFKRAPGTEKDSDCLIAAHGWIMNTPAGNEWGGFGMGEALHQSGGLFYYEHEDIAHPTIFPSTPYALHEHTRVAHYDARGTIDHQVETRPWTALSNDETYKRVVRHLMDMGAI